MKRKHFAGMMSLLMQNILVLVLSSVTTYAGTVATQTFNLQPGWNAIFLEVQPEPADIPSAFSSVSSLASVWTWNPQGLTLQYIQNPSEALRQDSVWRAYFPPSRGEDAFINNLFQLQANRAYLIEIKGNSNVTWTVSGVPSLIRREWIANSFNLTGFSVQKESPPAFGPFFADSRAHKGQAIYRLSAAGIWEFIENPSSTQMRSGEAFWIYTEGASTYAGPLAVVPDNGYDLNFFTLLDTRILKIRNISSAAKTVSVRLINTDGFLPLLKFTLDDNARVKWVPFGPVESISLAPGQEKPFRLGVKRADMTAGQVSALLEVSDGAGMLYRVPLSVEKGGI